MLGYRGAAILSNIGKALKGGVGAVVLLIFTQGPDNFPERRFFGPGESSSEYPV